jgi:hypothetical protein
MATIGDWLMGEFDFFGTAIQNWMVTVTPNIAVSSTVGCWNR